MEDTIHKTLHDSLEFLQAFMTNEANIANLAAGAELLIRTLRGGNAIYSCGNDGSMSDAMHFAEELTGRYRENRPGLPATAISDPGHISCVANDFGYEQIFSRYLQARAKPGDCVLAISTSGRSKNIIRAAEFARDAKISVLSLTGASGSALGALATVDINAGSSPFADRIQEVHIKIIHILIELIERGQNPETELLSYLTASEFRFVPQLYGTVSFRRTGRTYAMGILQEALPVQSDGWVYALDMMARFLDRVAGTLPPEAVEPPESTFEVPVWLEEVAPEMLSVCNQLGVRTAEMHIALCRATEEAIAPVEGSPEDVVALVERIRSEAAVTRKMLGDSPAKSALPDSGLWENGLRRLEGIRSTQPLAKKIRIHGDLHLGQVLRADGEFYILDFEGEPARSLDERRERDSALRDVAGMLRSIEYAILAGWQDHTNSDQDLQPWIDALLEWCERAFLAAYVGTAGEYEFLEPEQSRLPLLWAYLFDKGLYEVRYELSHRPAWTWLPLRGLDRLLHWAPEDDAPIEQRPQQN